MSRLSFTLWLVAALMAFRPAALAHESTPDPLPPVEGFEIVPDLDVPHVWSDGYQVLMDVRYPVDAPFSGGWPLIVLVHGGGGSKEVVAGAAEQLASHGYITVGYDVRGQGTSALGNPPSLQHDFTGLRELIDLFECMEAIEARYPDLVDFERIGVTGYSQGGGHSWYAAQHSGRLPPPNPWRTAAFPLVSAVVVKDSGGGIGSADDYFAPKRVEKAFSPAGILYQPAVTAALQTLVLAEDYAGFAAAVSAPGMDGAVLQPQVTVPVFAHASFDDKRVNPGSVFASWMLLPEATPKRFQLGTGGHGSPTNARDRTLYAENRRLWFDRFLKGDQNGVDSGPPIFSQVTPDDLVAYLDLDALWDFREHDTIPSIDAVMQRSYLDASGSLESAPAPGATDAALGHVVPAGVDIALYTSLLPSADALQLMIPLSTLRYDSPPLGEDTHMEGMAVVELAVDTAAADYQIHAVLFDVDPAGNERFVCSGSTSVLGRSGPNQVSITPYLQSYVFRVGHRIRLQLENLAIHRPPTGAASELKRVPYFTSSSVDVVQGGVTASFLDLPLLAHGGPTLSTYPPIQSVEQPADQLLTIHSHSGFAGATYLLLPGLSGTTPGAGIAGAQVPIKIDELTLAVLANPGMAPFVQALGTLDATGSAHPGVALAGLPLPSDLAGLELSMSALIVAGGHAATNAVTVPFTP
jgi:predicted acyl esterase